MTSGSRSNPLPVVPRDEMTTSLRRIETLAALLEELTARNPREPVEGVLVSATAGMIADEAIRLRDALRLDLDARP
jgi:hypothetical protein